MREISLAPPCVNVGKQAAVKRQTRFFRKSTIAVCQHAAVKRQTRCMRKPTTACQRANSKVLGPAVYKKYCRVQRNREFVPVQWGRWGRLTMKWCGRGSRGRLYGRGTNPCVTCWKVPYIGPERGKLREVNPVSAINTDEEKSGKRRAEARGNSAPLPHMTHSPRTLSGSSRVPGHWEAKSSAVPGRHTAGWANEPWDWTLLLLLLRPYVLSLISVLLNAMRARSRYAKPELFWLCKCLFSDINVWAVVSIHWASCVICINWMNSEVTYLFTYIFRVKSRAVKHGWINLYNIGIMCVTALYCKGP